MGGDVAQRNQAPREGDSAPGPRGLSPGKGLHPQVEAAGRGRSAPYRDAFPTIGADTACHSVAGPIPDHVLYFLGYRQARAHRTLELRGPWRWNVRLSEATGSVGHVVWPGLLN